MPDPDGRLSLLEFNEQRREADREAFMRDELQQIGLAHRAEDQRNKLLYAEASEEIREWIQAEVAKRLERQRQKRGGLLHDERGWRDLILREVLVEWQRITRSRNTRTARSD